jgi:hypothetical protein
MNLLILMKYDKQPDYYLLSKNYRIQKFLLLRFLSHF